MQILEHNIRHTNVIAIQDVILIAKILVGSAKKKKLIIDMPNMEVTQKCNATNVLLKYNWYLNPTDDEVVVNLELQSIKKYWRYAIQVADELSHLQDLLPTLIMFVNKAHSNYNQKMQLDKCLRFKQNKNYK